MFGEGKISGVSRVGEYCTGTDEIGNCSCLSRLNRCKSISPCFSNRVRYSCRKTRCRLFLIVFEGKTRSTIRECHISVCAADRGIAERNGKREIQILIGVGRTDNRLLNIQSRLDLFVLERRRSNPLQSDRIGSPGSVRKRSGFCLCRTVKHGFGEIDIRCLSIRNFHIVVRCSGNLNYSGTVIECVVIHNCIDMSLIQHIISRGALGDTDFSNAIHIEAIFHFLDAVKLH